MLIRKNTLITNDIMVFNELDESLSLNVYHIKAKDLKKIIGLSITQIDELIENIHDIPIKKYRKLGTTFYMFPIELVLSNFILTKASSV